VVLKELKKEAEEEGKGYQSLINEILGKHVSKKVA
jgi:predicted DNA binding CopG/RHH family protein